APIRGLTTEHPHRSADPQPDVHPRDRGARADERPCHGVLREGVRDHVPGAPQERRGRARARSPAGDAHGDGRARGRLRRAGPRGNAGRPRARLGRGRAHRRPHARGRRRLADARRLGRLRDALDARDRRGPRRGARRRPPRAGDPVGQRQRVPCLHPRGTHPLAGARVIAALLIALGQVLVAGAGAPLLVGVVRTLKARLAGRRGPSPWQPYADLRKLLGKEPVVSTTTSWVFRATPYVLVATMLVTALVVPVLVARPALGFAGNIILLMYLFMLGTFILALAGLDSGSAFGGMG